MPNIRNQRRISTHTAKCDIRRQWLSALLMVSATATAAHADDQKPKTIRMPAIRMPAVSSPSNPAPATPTVADPAASRPTQATAALPVATAKTRYLRSSTSVASMEIARRMIEQATQEYNAHAWMSAEASAWEALQHAAEAIDLAKLESGVATSPSAITARQNLEIGKNAILEARDFTGVYGAVDDDAIHRIARSHQTSVVPRKDPANPASLVPLEPSDVADQYLDFARVHFATIAGQDQITAQAMDLLAAVYLDRADAKTLPSETALCLRRAALQGQPNNASLASRLGMHLSDIGLLGEARWALEHSMSIDFDPRTAEALVKVMRSSGDEESATRMLASIQARTGTQSYIGNQAAEVSANGYAQTPEIVELTPSEFASVSKSVMPPSQLASAPATPTNRVPASLASAKLNHAFTTDSPQSQPFEPAMTEVDENNREQQPNALRRLFGKFKKPW
ncbi:hypothetical protein [Rubripirellula reticaptiva]|uniref:Uncharacterized protein n=1 Tax=Rubripirellula reticaptiva TaxID=2528013 RepID=A0A5C6EU20_9BACT|nr:hypothetical protein [Rubripirellula reticaptiva]TWU51884.1 hypothetical protein Poly59_34800 [Rubripirellula reticaptiva]